MENPKKYNIGLDIGVGSVGWCVTDEEENILKKGNKNMWGARISDLKHFFISKNFVSIKNA